MKDSYETESLSPEDDFLLIHVRDQGIPAAVWAANHREVLKKTLLRHGAILLRGLTCDRHGFAEIAKALEPKAINYTGGIGPRTIVAEDVYTSTDLPSSYGLVQHHEMAYNSFWPMNILFYCEQPPEVDGATTVCNSSRLLAALDPAIRDAFERKKLRYLRNFSNDMPYKNIADTFGTTDRATIDAFCAKTGVTPTWRSSDRLTLTQDAPAIRRHPEVEKAAFFNTILVWHFAHWKHIAQHTFSEHFARLGGEEDYWLHCQYGDGTAIDDATVAEIERKYEELQFKIAWQKGDILYLDNMLVSHGRRPFSGKRTILASFRTPLEAKNLSTGRSVG